MSEVWDDEFLYRSVKADAHDEVDGYLEAHRRPVSAPDSPQRPDKRL